MENNDKKRPKWPTALLVILFLLLIVAVVGFFSRVY